MNARYQIHPEKGYVESWLVGRITPSEMWEHTLRVWSEPEWKADLNGLMDLSNATLDFSDAELRSLLQSMMADPRCSLARWAFIVTTASTFGTLRKIDKLSEQQSTIRIFFSRDDAEKWLLEPQKKSRGTAP
jgi:hypothetical protein